MKAGAIRAESSLPGVVTSVKPGANKGDYEVTLQLAKDSKPGDLDGTVKIYTSDKMNPIVTVPVKGTVKALSASTDHCHVMARDSNCSPISRLAERIEGGTIEASAR